MDFIMHRQMLGRETQLFLITSFVFLQKLKST